MRDARAIVNGLLEAEEPENIDWAVDPEAEGLPSSVPRTFSGVPGGSEPLLRKEQFRDRAKEHTGGYTQRTGWYRDAPSHAMYSNYRGARRFTFPHGTRIHKLDDRTFAVFWPDGGIGIQVHGTLIIKREANGNYVCNTGGWVTPLTLGRLDDYLPFGWKLYRKQGEFYWFNHSTGVGYVDGFIIPFTDGDQIYNDGALVPQAEARRRRVKRKVNEANSAYEGNRDEPATQ